MREESESMNFKNLILISLFFFYFLNTKFSVIPIYTYQIVIIIMITYFLINKKHFYLEVKLKHFFFFYVIVFAYILFNYYINNFEDITLVKKWIIFLLKSFIGVYLLLLILKAYKYSFMEMIYFLQIIIFIHASLMLIYFFNVDFKEWTLNFIPQTGGNIDHITSYRSRGIVSSSGATLSLFQSFGLLFTVYLVSKEKLNWYLTNYFLISFIIILGSIVVSGRTGLVILPIILLYIILLYFKDLESSKKSIKFLLLLLLLFTMFISLIYLLNIKIVTLDSILFLKDWIGSEIKINNGEIQVSTLTILSNHWLFPNEPFSWFFGKTVTWEIDRIKTDIGYLRVLNALGILGFIFLYGFILWIFIETIKNLSDYRNKILVLVLCIFLLITEYKEPFLFKVELNMMILILYISTILLKEKIE